MSLADYLSKNYASKKSKKRSKTNEFSKVVIEPDFQGSNNIQLDTNTQVDLIDRSTDLASSRDKTTTTDPDSKWKPISNSGYGLISAAEFKNTPDENPKDLKPEQSTTYRDKSGRVVDLDRLKEDEVRVRIEALKGEVQKKQEDNELARLQQARTMRLTVGQDDQEVNAIQKAAPRAEDPLSIRTPQQSIGTLPTYKGAYPPNRFDIKPGIHWDGVDRGNGFETKYIARHQQAETLKRLNYQSQIDI
ncbi:hypothetical protein CANCADRAFT_42656 [Tortispora caseinolytica NRRL Y-17796]|uniref:Pre-mRNA-splicing factor CWC26 n=1 Tax=Tortispora caseinolytica NRRL Y-17796 TaxID=767744 RepID=A0A1E4TJY8_9ASCO|nr:hypothetical protein CANCADRAFT_42656 [Tortispora caseinolytica NRRL Y-17796]